MHELSTAELLKQRMVDQVSYKAQISNAKAPLPFGTLMRSLVTLDELTRTNPDSLRLVIPDTIICTYEQSITYLYTNERGFIQSTQIRAEQITELA